MKKMSVNEIRDFIFENCYKRIGFSKESSYYSMKRLKRKDLLLLANKLIEKVPDRHNAKEHCESFLRKKNKKSITTEHPKTSHELSKTIRKGEKVDSNRSLVILKN